MFLRKRRFEGWIKNIFIPLQNAVIDHNARINIHEKRALETSGELAELKNEVRLIEERLGVEYIDGQYIEKKEYIPARLEPIKKGKK